MIANGEFRTLDYRLRDNILKYNFISKFDIQELNESCSQTKNEISITSEVH